MYFYPDMPHHVIVYHLTVTLSSLNSCMDPIVYCFVTNNFQVITISCCLSHLIWCHPSHQSPSLILLFSHRFAEQLYCLSVPQATMRNIFRRQEPEQTSGDIISMQHSSKGSGGTPTAITNNVIMMTKISTALKDPDKNHTV